MPGISSRPLRFSLAVKPALEAAWGNNSAGKLASVIGRPAARASAEQGLPKMFG